MDLIERNKAIDVAKKLLDDYGTNAITKEFADDVAEIYINKVPSAQPEIVRCKDCIFHGLCRASTRWAVAPKDDWYCADAERRTDGTD